MHRHQLAILLHSKIPLQDTEQLKQELIIQGLCADDFRYCVNKVCDYHEDDLSLYLAFASRHYLANNLIEADVSRTLLDFKEFLDLSRYLQHHHRKAKFETDLRQVLYVSQSCGLISYYQGIGSILGVLLLSRMNCIETFSFLRQLSRTDFKPFLMNNNAFATILSSLTINLLAMRNPTLNAFKDQDCRLKLETLILSWNLSSFTSAIGLPELFSLLFMTSQFGCKATVCMSLALLELEVDGMRAGKHLLSRSSHFGPRHHRYLLF